MDKIIREVMLLNAIKAELRYSNSFSQEVSEIEYALYEKLIRDNSLPELTHQAILELLAGAPIN